MGLRRPQGPRGRKRGFGVGLGGVLADIVGTRALLAVLGLALIVLALGSRRALEYLDRPAQAASHRADNRRVSWAGDADPAAS